MGRALAALARLRAKPMHLAVCISCGCDDLHACDDGLGAPCYWVAVDRKHARGICSECAMRMLHALLDGRSYNHG